MRADLTGRVVAITGGAGGLGLALGRAFSARGARVALLDVDRARLEEAAATLTPPAYIARCDVTDPVACAHVISDLVQELGGLDILVNNAGISHVSELADTELGVLRRVMDVNYFGSVHCTLAALPHLRAQRGWVVAMSSVAGFAPLVGRTGYCASKHALHGFFDTLRAELAGTGVSVLLACPGFANTAIRRNALDGAGRPLGAGAGGPAGLDPDAVARRIVRAVEKRERQVQVGGTARASWLLWRIAPRVYEALMRRAHTEGAREEAAVELRATA